MAHFGITRGTVTQAMAALLPLLVGLSATICNAEQAGYSGPTEPAKAPAHLRVSVITCYSILHGCVAPADGIREAGSALGWTVTVLDGGGTPRRQNAAMLDALSAGTDVVVTVAIDPKLVQLGLQAAKKAGIPVVAGSDGIDTPNSVQAPTPGTLGYAFDVAPDYGSLGRQTADWISKDAAGKAAVGVFSDREFPSVLAVQVGLLDGFQHHCPGCKISVPQYFTASQVGTSLGQQTVGYMRANPDTNYVFSPYDPAAADQVTALAQAGMMSQVKLIGVLGNQQNLAFIRAGRIQVADAAYDNRYMGYAIVDQIIRLKNGKPLFQPHGENLPFTVLDQKNLPAPGEDWHAAYDYRARFLALWK